MGFGLVALVLEGVAAEAAGLLAEAVRLARGRLGCAVGGGGGFVADEGRAERRCRGRGRRRGEASSAGGCVRRPAVRECGKARGGSMASSSSWASMQAGERAQAVRRSLFCGVGQADRGWLLRARWLVVAKGGDGVRGMDLSRAMGSGPESPM